MKSFRQGDVLIRTTTRTPSAHATHVLDAGRTILAYGEVTGHAHEVIAGTVITDDAVPAQQLFEEPDGTRILVVRRDVALRHQEHDLITIPPNTYEVIRQREYTPEAIRQVTD